MGILTWIVLGLVAGLLARIVMPGKSGGGLILTIIVGIVGAMLGGFIATRMGYGDISGFDLRSLGIAFLGSMLVLLILGALQGRK